MEMLTDLIEIKEQPGEPFEGWPLGPLLLWWNQSNQISDIGTMEHYCQVKNKLGLHARASAKLVQLSNRYDSDFTIQYDGQEVDGKSILSILTLACPLGSKIRLKAEGPDAEKLLEAIERLINDKFGEE